MKKVVTIAMALLGLLGLSGGTVLADHEKTMVVLMEQNNSGQSGTAIFTLSDDASSITVEIDISGGSEVPQPAHIHIGSCENLDPRPFYPLTSVVNGKSVTVITEADVVDLDYEVSNQFAINVHKSAAEANVYVACGNIHEATTVGGVGMPRTGSGDTLPMLALVGLMAVTLGTVLSLSRRKA
jgi:LPXTG-motif cell wall-anchored protein